MGVDRNRRPADKSEEAPPFPLFVSDFPRALADLGALVATFPLLSGVAARGDGHPVLVLPGLAADDASTLTLRLLLRWLGYDAHGWGLGRNVGPTARILSGMRRRVGEISEGHQQRVSLVGWSLGGFYVRELARETPDSVRQVITLGTAFRLSHPNQSRARRAFGRHSHLHVPPEQLPPPERMRSPLPVPSTSIYSKLDGIVAWRACLDEVGPQRENVAVYSSHFGLGHNPGALWVVADRLAQPDGAWQPFRPPAWARPLFPPAEAP